ncbi:MAG: phosphotransferase [Clostridia bacterium]|nr:phosphotransferase [Clostridia bacterium]
MELKDIIEENYNIKINDIIKSTESTDGNVYIVDSDRYVVKVYGDLEHTKSMVELHNSLCENGINVPKIIKNNDEKYYTEFDGKYYVLYSFLDGKQLHLYQNSGKIDRKLIEKIANCLRRFHDVTEGENKFNLPDVPFSVNDNLRKSVLHFDITNHNIFVKKDLIGLIDFDDAKYGVCVCDVAIAVGNLFFSKTRGIDLEGVKVFIDSYYGDDIELKSIEEKYIKEYSLKWIDYILDNNEFDTSTTESFEVKKKLIEENINNEENEVKEKKMEHKTKYIISIVLLAITVILLTVSVVALIINYNKITGNMNLAKNGIIVKEAVLKVNRDEVILGKGERVSIIKDDIINNEYTIKYNEQIGRIEKDAVSYFVLDSKEREPLMLDVSQFNIAGKESEENPNKNFQNEKDFELFVLNNDIQYVYIRLGGRGWGQKGVLYYDDEAPRYIEACEYLGVPYGFYFLDEALNDEEIIEEVNFVKEFLDKNKTKMNILPLALDLEYQSGKGRADNIWEERTVLLNKLIDEFNKIGVNCIIYSNGARIEKYIKGVNTMFWVAMYPQDDIIPQDSYGSVVKINQLEEELNQMSNASIIDKILNKGGTDVKKYSDEFLNKVLGWQFTESGASKDGIEDYIDLSVMNNKLFKNYFEK